MAIQNRRGDYSDFDPQKLVPGEWAVVLSGDPNSERGKAVYMAFDVGDVERMATYEDMQENIESATSDVQAQFASELTQTIADANTAVSTMQNDINNEISSATATIDNLTLQVNTATGNARTAAEQANQAADSAYDAADAVQSIIDAGETVASWNNRVGLVVPQAGDYTSAQITHDNTTVEDALTFDSVPIEDSTRAVQSGGVFAVLGDAPLGTTATTISGAIAEHSTSIATARAAIPHVMLHTFQWTGIGVGSNRSFTANRDIQINGYKPIAIAGAEILDDTTGGKNAGWCLITVQWIGSGTFDGVTKDSMTYSIWNQHPSDGAMVRILFKILYISENGTI